MHEVPVWLTIVYDVSQIFVPAIAIVAACIALRQIKASATFELTKYIQDKDLREARGKLMFNEAPFASWKADERAAASKVAASYDTMGNLLKLGLAHKKTFIKAYASSVQLCFEKLEPYFEEVARTTNNDPDYFSGLNWLYRECERRHPIKGPRLFMRRAVEPHR